MTDHAAHHDEPATGEHAHAPGQHAHPSAKEYIGIAVVLTVIHPFLAPILLTLSALKFGIVAMWYMHLKFDPRLYSWVFVVPMIFAAAIILSLIVLMSRHRG
jgi:cytochrome c oxidase subunit 4